MARSDILEAGVELGLSLDRYAELLRIPEAAFNGLNKPDDEFTFACNTIWKQHNRDMLALHIARAEEKRENELDFHLFRKYDEEDFKYTRNPIILPEGYLVEIGEQNIDDIDLGVTVTLRDIYLSIIDPVIISVTTTVTDTSEIKVYYPGESVEIHPSAISISGGTATISIPRSRLVKPELNDNRDDSLYYETDANFLETVDVKRVWYDESEGAKFVWLNCTTGAEMTQRAQPFIDHNENSIIRILPANYSAGTWTLTSYAYNGEPYKIRLKYLSGKISSTDMQMLTVKLAHSLMPYKPIDCESVTQYWQDDHEVNARNPMTPYGNKNGAVECWVSDSRWKKGTGGMFG